MSTEEGPRWFLGGDVLDAPEWPGQLPGARAGDEIPDDDQILTPPLQGALPMEKPQMSDLPTSTEPREATGLGQAGHEEKNRSWWPFIGGIIIFFLLMGGVYWWTHREPVATTETITAIVSEPPVEAITEAETPETLAEPEATPPAAEPATAPTATATTATPTNCKFVDGSRPQEDGKYILICTEGEYLAIGEYDYAIQNFKWTDFEERNSPK